LTSYAGMIYNIVEATASEYTHVPCFDMVNKRVFFLKTGEKYKEVFLKNIDNMIDDHPEFEYDFSNCEKNYQVYLNTILENRRKRKNY